MVSVAFVCHYRNIQNDAKSQAQQCQDLFMHFLFTPKNFCYRVELRGINTHHHPLCYACVMPCLFFTDAIMVPQVAIKNRIIIPNKKILATIAECSTL